MGEVAMYVVNYKDNQGYLILSANKDYQPILAFNETGNFHVNQAENNGSFWWMQEQIHRINNTCLLPDSVRSHNNRAWNRFAERKEPLDLVSDARVRATDSDLQYQVGVYIEETMQKWNNTGYIIYSYGDGSVLSEFFSDSEIPSIKEYLMANAEDRFFGGLAGTVYLRVKQRSLDDVMEPLLQSTWNQTGGYATYTSNGYAGCVATAVGQIMRYHQYPNSYNWGGMVYTYPTDLTAQFLKDIGLKSDMKYESNGSSATIIGACSTLKEYGYRQSSIVTHNPALVTGQLRKRQPVCMCGGDNAAAADAIGHAWVCDGYKETEVIVDCEVMAIDKATFDYTGRPEYRSMYSGMKSDFAPTYYHMNWGWGGYHDGFYIDTDLGIKYLYSRKDIINIHP